MQVFFLVTFYSSAYTIYQPGESSEGDGPVGLPHDDVYVVVQSGDGLENTRGGSLQLQFYLI